MRLIRLVSKPEPDAVRRASKSVKSVRRKAQKLLSRIGNEYGLAMVFLCTQASSMTQLAFLKAADVSAQLAEVCTQLGSARGLIRIAEKLQAIHRLEYRIRPDHPHGDLPAARGSLTDQSNRGLQQIANPMTKCLVLEIDTKYLAKFLKRENDCRPMRIICPYGRQPEAPYIVVRDS